MWFEWFVRRCDMGALAVAVSPVQPPSGVDGHGSENTISQSVPDVATLLSRRKAERRAPTPHAFPPSPLPGSAIMANELVPPSSCMVWSPSFDNSPCKDLGYHAGPGGLKAFSISPLGDASSELGGPFVSDQKQPLNQLAKNYLQTVQELKQPLEPEQLSPRYRELKAGFWKRLAADTRCDPPKHEPCDYSSSSGTRVEPFADGGISRSSNPATGCKKATFPRMQGHSHGRGGPLDRGPNGSVEIEVVLTGKWNVNTVEEAAMLQKPDAADDAKQDTAAGLGHVQNGACNPCEKDIRHHREPNLPARDGIDQSSAAAAVENSGYRDDDLCRTGASSREASDGESLKRGVVASHLRSCESNPQQHQLRQEERQKDGSECSFGSRRGIGRGRIGEDGSPTSTSSNHEVCEEWNTSAGNLGCNRKDEDGTFWSTASWCVVDSYMTGHGKETTWTVRGFEEDDGIFEESSPHFKERNPLKLFASEKNRSRFSDLPVNQFLPIEGHDVETRHGPPPKWTQQVLQERVAKNLQEQQKEVRSSKNRLEIVRPAHKLTEENAEDGGRDDAECREVVLDDLMSVGDKQRCRKGRKMLKEAILKETRDKVGGGDTGASPTMNDTESASISASWKSVPRTLNACVGPSTYRNDQEKELPVLNLVSRRDLRRRKRGWARRKAKTPATAAACCVSMIGDTLKALRRTREDAAALALKLAELQAAELKDFKAAAYEMRTHVDSLRSEVEGLETERGFNVLMVFPWQQFLKNIVIGISLVSGTLGLHRAIKSLFRLLFGRAELAQTATSRKEKTMIAIVILCSGSFVGKEMWLMFSQVQAQKKRNEAIFQEKLRLILERLSHMSTLTYKNGPVHLGQAEEPDQTVLV